MSLLNLYYPFITSSFILDFRFFPYLAIISYLLNSMMFNTLIQIFYRENSSYLRIGFGFC